MSRVEPPPARRLRLAGLAAVLVALASLSAPAGAADRPEFPLRLSAPDGSGEFTVTAGPRVLHLVFFATWCPPCIDELPRLAELEARWGDRGYRLVLVAVPYRQSRDRLEQFMLNHRPPGTLGFDTTGAVQRTFGVQELPAHILVGPDGAVLARAGALGPEIRQRVSTLLSKGAP